MVLQKVLNKSILYTLFLQKALNFFYLIWFTYNFLYYFFHPYDTMNVTKEKEIYLWTI